MRAEENRSATWIEVKIEDTEYTGDHLFWMMSKHNVPSGYTEQQKHVANQIKLI